MLRFKSYFIIGYNFFFSKMIKDYVNEIKELQSSHVYIKSKDVVNKLINDIVNGGPNKLQVVSDFDRTITKQYEDGKEYFSSFGIFSVYLICLSVIYILKFIAIIGKCPSVTERYLLKEKENTSKFRPIEMDPNLSINEKIEDMEKWWRLSEFELKYYLTYLSSNCLPSVIFFF